MLLTIESNFRYDIIFLGRVIKSKILYQPVDGNFTLSLRESRYACEMTTGSCRGLRSKSKANQEQIKRLKCF